MGVLIKLLVVLVLVLLRCTFQLAYAITTINNGMSMSNCLFMIKYCVIISIITVSIQQNVLNLYKKNNVSLSGAVHVKLLAQKSLKQGKRWFNSFMHSIKVLNITLVIQESYVRMSTIYKTN